MSDWSISIKGRGDPKQIGEAAREVGRQLVDNKALGTRFVGLVEVEETDARDASYSMRNEQFYNVNSKIDRLHEEPVAPDLQEPTA